MTDVESCLPAQLRGPATDITRLAAGLSGAGVYRVDRGGEAFVLKVSAADEPLDAWRRRTHTQRLAADAGLAPPVVHLDEERRAVVSAFVVDRSFPALIADPATREAAVAQLGHTLRRVHQLPLPPDSTFADPRLFLAGVWSGSLDGSALPAFVRDAVRGLLDEEPPRRERALVLSHNDVNPTNLVHDGEKLLLLDWDTAGPNDPIFDLATASVFFRMDEETSLGLIAAYDGTPLSTLPAGFAYNRRLAATLCGALFLRLALQGGHAGDPDATLDSAPTLLDFYQRMRAGSVSVATGEGQWWFGLALVRQAVTG